MALAARGQAAGARAGEGHRRLRHRGHRGGAARLRASAAGHRGAADGRHEYRRRPVRRRQDVPAAGGQERACHEARRGPPGPLHRAEQGRLGRPPQQRPHRDGDRQGRRARHRQEHRRRRSAVQQFRGHRPRRHGALREDPRHRPARERGLHRPLRADHPLAGRDGERRPRDAAAGIRAAAADRRRHHLARAYLGEDRAAVPLGRGLREGRLAIGRHLPDARQPGAARGARREGQRGARAPARAARRQEGEGAGAQHRAGAGQPPPHRLGRLRARGAARAGRAHLREVPARGAARLHRLDAVLQRLGAHRKISGGVQRPEGRRGGEQSLRRCAPAC